MKSAFGTNYLLIDCCINFCAVMNCGNRHVFEKLSVHTIPPCFIVSQVYEKINQIGKILFLKIQKFAFIHFKKIMNMLHFFIEIYVIGRKNRQKNLQISLACLNLAILKKTKK